MNKQDFHLILKTILNSTIFILIICICLKIFNFNLFTIDLNNKTINNFHDFLITYKLIPFIKIIFIFIYTFFILKSCAENKKLYIYVISASLISILSYAVNYLIFDNIILSIIYFVVILLVFNSAISQKINIIKPLYLNCKIFFYLLIVCFIRSLKLSDLFNIKVILILSIDLFLLLSVYYFFDKFNLREYKFDFKLLKKIKLCISKINYSSLILISKYVIALISIIFIAYLNNTIIECLIILNSFFVAQLYFCNHLNFQSTVKFYLFSTFAFYILNRITFKVGISLIIPISLGVIFAYFTCTYVIKNMKINLYRGMDENKLRLVCINNKLNSFETNLLIDFYCYKLTLQDLAFKYSYSKDAIWKKKKHAIKKITNN